MNDRPVSTHPGLRAFVEAARKQPLVEPTVTADEVQRAWEAERRRVRTRRTVIWSAAAAAAVAALISGVVARDWSPGLEFDGAHRQAALTLLVEDRPQRFALEPAAVPDSVDSVAMPRGLRVRSTGSVDVVGPSAIALGDGVHTVSLELGDGAREPLRVALPGRTLELQHGEVELEVVAGRVEVVRLHRGVAAWVTEGGERTELTVETTTLAVRPAGEADLVDASTLAREADRLLAAGERSEAMRVLGQLVRKFPRSGEARAAVLDLARLLEAAGRVEEARCAYQVYRTRWPSSPVSSDVEARLTKLGGERACRGLRPR